jgi:hypothetical protein
MPTALLALGLVAVGSLGVLAVSAVMLSSRISREEEQRGPGWILQEGDGEELLASLRERGM